ncbi:MAG: phosphate transport system regulatory protein PhoU, partial [Gemmataceae bacterium]
QRFAAHAAEVARRVIFPVTGSNPDDAELPISP